MTFEDGYTIPFENGDFIHDRNWYYIVCGAALGSDGMHALVYHVLIGELEEMYPYCSVGPSTGIGYWDTRDFNKLKPVTNEERDKIYEVLHHNNCQWDEEKKMVVTLDTREPMKSFSRLMPVIER